MACPKPNTLERVLQEAEHRAHPRSDAWMQCPHCKVIDHDYRTPTFEPSCPVCHLVGMVEHPDRDLWPAIEAAYRIGGFDAVDAMFGWTNPTNPVGLETP